MIGVQKSRVRRIAPLTVLAKVVQAVGPRLARYPRAREFHSSDAHKIGLP